MAHAPECTRTCGIGKCYSQDHKLMSRPRISCVPACNGVTQLGVGFTFTFLGRKVKPRSTILPFDGLDYARICCILIKSLGKQMEPGKYISHLSITLFWSDHFGWRLESRPSKATPIAKIPSQNMDFTTSGIHNMCRMSHSTQGQDRQEALLIVEEKSLISVKLYWHQKGIWFRAGTQAHDIMHKIVNSIFFIFFSRSSDKSISSYEFRKLQTLLAVPGPGTLEIHLDVPT